MSNSKTVFVFAFILFFTVIACGIFTPSPSDTLPIIAETPMEIPTLAGGEARTLTVCIGQEPNTLYPFGELNSSARSVLAAVYDDAYDLINYEYQPNILEEIPSIENGGAQILPAQVSSGMDVVDANGEVVKLSTGDQVRPSGCRADDCVISYDGASDLEMDQLVVRFKMRKDLIWSDGVPVTADDSLFTFTLASSSAVFGAEFLTARTATYEVADTHIVDWWSKPGFIDSSYETNFFPPAPKHKWGDFPVEQISTIDIASRSPMGWGPYILQEWIAKDYIRLIKNPYYFRAAQGSPKFETLIFRFISDPNTALTELVAGRCDILDPSIRLDNHVNLLREMEKAEQAQFFSAPGMTIEWLGLGVTPSSYDDGYNINFQVDRQDFFGDAHTRQAIAYCLDRQTVVDNVLFGLTSVPTTYIPVEHPVYDTNVEDVRFDPSVGMSLLQQAGWRDTDGNPETPIVAVTVKNVAPGTPLQLNYYTTTSTQRRQTADILARSLSQCGIGLNVQYFSQNELYTSGPEGNLFGRKFDLIQYAMGVDGITPPCNWFISAEIPTAENEWIGTNLTGYKNPEYDIACRQTQLALPGETEYGLAYRQTQVIFADELPAIPLYYRLRIAAARPDLCNFTLDPTANPLWNIEAYDVGEGCQK